MSEDLRANRYRQLFIQLGDQRARGLLDNLQVLALTRPEALRELELFIDRNAGADLSGEPVSTVAAPAKVSRQR